MPQLEDLKAAVPRFPVEAGYFAVNGKVECAVAAHPPFPAVVKLSQVLTPCSKRHFFIKTINRSVRIDRVVLLRYRLGRR